MPALCRRFIFWNALHFFHFFPMLPNGYYPKINIFYKKLLIFTPTPSATGITGIMLASALPHVGLYSSNACGLRHYPTQTKIVNLLQSQISSSIMTLLFPQMKWSWLKSRNPHCYPTNVKWSEIIVTSSPSAIETIDWVCFLFHQVWVRKLYPVSILEQSFEIRHML